MKLDSTIQFLHHEKIDKTRWDECIYQAENGLIYAHSYYLDEMAPEWNALTDDNYDWVMPITSKQKLGIQYLYQPNFTQQLGVFYKAGTIVPWREIMEWMQSRFRFWEVNWNYATPQKQVSPPVQLQQGNNFILDLSNSHYDIAAKYHTILKKNLKHSKQFKVHYQSVLDYEKSIDMYIQYYGDRMPHVKQWHYNAFRNICAAAYVNEKLVCREVVDENNNVHAIVLLLTDGRRLYNMINATTEDGRRSEANHLLYDSIINEFSESDLFLDFEGSDLPGVKTFYTYFGVVNQPYYMLRYNKLPWPLRWLKR